MAINLLGSVGLIAFRAFEKVVSNHQFVDHAQIWGMVSVPEMLRDLSGAAHVYGLFAHRARALLCVEKRFLLGRDRRGPRGIPARRGACLRHCELARSQR